MKHNLEIEYKTMLDEPLFEKIKSKLPFDSGVNQRNDYYDTPDRQLYSMGIMCRIRTVDNRFEFTVKIPQEDGVMEHEVLLETKTLDHPSVINFFNQLNLDVSQLDCIAYSDTQRYTYDDAYGSWCLDASSFENHNDFELEYELHEANEKAYPHYVDMLNELDVEYREAKPKYIRALTSGA